MLYKSLKVGAVTVVTVMDPANALKFSFRTSFFGKAKIQLQEFSETLQQKKLQQEKMAMLEKLTPLWLQIAEAETKGDEEEQERHKMLENIQTEILPQISTKTEDEVRSEFWANIAKLRKQAADEKKRLDGLEPNERAKEIIKKEALTVGKRRYTAQAQHAETLIEGNFNEQCIKGEKEDFKKRIIDKLNKEKGWNKYAEEVLELMADKNPDFDKDFDDIINNTVDGFIIPTLKKIKELYEKKDWETLCRMDRFGNHG